MSSINRSSIVIQRHKPKSTSVGVTQIEPKFARVLVSSSSSNTTEPIHTDKDHTEDDQIDSDDENASEEDTTEVVPIRTKVITSKSTAASPPKSFQPTITRTTPKSSIPVVPTFQKSTATASQSSSSSSSSSPSYYPSLNLFRSHLILLIPLILSGLLFSNSLYGEFAFDDHFALVDNIDSNPQSPFLPLFFHDFWGAPLASNSSHKSFRPFTIWSWRLQRSAIQTIVGQEALQPIEGVRLAQEIKPSGWKDAFIALATPSDAYMKSVPAPASPAASSTASVLLKQPWYPFLFHVSNVLLHIYCTFLVYVAAFHIFNLRVTREDEITKTVTTTDEDANTTTSAKSQNEYDAFPDDLFRRRAIFLSFCTATLFAVHPIHTEAVSGIVGHAELLCCAWYLMAFLCWWWSNLLLSSAGELRGTSVGLRAFCTNLSLICFLVATLCKEIGFTLIAIFILIDAVHAAMILCIGGIAVPDKINQSNNQEDHSTTQTPQPSRRGVVGINSSSSTSSAPSIAWSTWFLHFLSLLWPRFLLLFICSSFYLFWRRLLAGSTIGVGQAVFRNIENPLAFEPNGWVRAFTNAMVHGKYMQLLISPWYLCCDYSLNCLPIVTTIFDLRLWWGICTYGLVFGALGLSLLQLGRILNTKRIETMRLICMSAGHTISSQTHATTSLSSATSSKRFNAAASTFLTRIQRVFESMPTTGPFAASDWHLNLSVYSSLLFAVALLVVPFLPAANLFFYVGTFVAERVLYIPSIGYSMLVALVFERCLFTGLEWKELQPHELDGKSTSTVEEPANNGHESSPPAFTRTMPRVHRNRILILVLGFLILLLTFSLLTVSRNQDWRSEDRLFSSAYTVCPTSIKVLQNYGILHRRNLAYSSALAFFQKIPRIDPNYCEHTYWIGLTKINLGNIPLGIKLLKQSLTCLFTRNQALSALHKLFEEILKNMGMGLYGGSSSKKEKSLSSSAAAGTTVDESSEWEILGEWGEIMYLVGQHETSAKYAIHAGTLSFSANNYTYALSLFQKAYDATRHLVYDKDGRLLNDPNSSYQYESATSSSKSTNQQRRSKEDDFGLSDPSSSTSDTDDKSSSSPSSIFSSRNYRCAAEYWLGRTHLILGNFRNGSMILKSMISNESVALPQTIDSRASYQQQQASREQIQSFVNKLHCPDFELHALDHLVEYAQKELEIMNELTKKKLEPTPPASTTNSKPSKKSAKSAASSSDSASLTSSISLQAATAAIGESHAILGFVLAHLGKNVTAAVHYQAAAQAIEGRLLEQAAAAAEKDSLGQPVGSPLQIHLADRLKAIDYYRIAMQLDPKLDRAKYALAISLIETGVGVEEGINVLQRTQYSTDEQVRASSITALQTLQNYRQGVKQHLIQVVDPRLT